MKLAPMLWRCQAVVESSDDLAETKFFDRDTREEAMAAGEAWVREVYGVEGSDIFEAKPMSVSGEAVVFLDGPYVAGYANLWEMPA